MESKELDMFCKKKPLTILLMIKNSSKPKCGSSLARESKTTYCYIHKLLKEMKLLGLISFERNERVLNVVLTEKGMNIASMFESISNVSKK